MNKIQLYSVHIYKFSNVHSQMAASLSLEFRLLSCHRVIYMVTVLYTRMCFSSFSLQTAVSELN